MHRAIKNSQLELIPVSGHLPNLEQPVAFDAILSDIPEEVMKNILASAAVILATVIVTAQDYQPSPDLEALHVPFDALLDLHVRDGLVYYRALQGDRGRLRRYIASLNSPSVVSGYEKWSSDQKKAFWLNAYNALVLQTVIDHYPIRGGSKDYPANSIRQIPGAFEKTPHTSQGSSVTLDQIENTVLAEFERSTRVPRTGAGSGREWPSAERGIQRQGGRQTARTDQGAVCRHSAVVEGRRACRQGEHQPHPQLARADVHRGIRRRFVRPAQARADRARGDRIPAAASARRRKRSSSRRTPSSSPTSRSTGD